MKRIVQLFSVFLLLSGFVSSALAAEELKKIRIGWQIPWATQGQLVQILKRTDILKKNGLEAEFVGRTFGPMLNELAIAGSLDVVLTGDQPGLVLISKDKGWRAIARLMYNRTSTYVPTTSPLKSLKDLKGKTLALPVGAAAERVSIQALKEVGLDPAKDVKIVNLDIREQAPLVNKTKGKATFDQFDALAGFDPIPAIFETQKLVKVLHVGKVVSLVIMNDSFLKKDEATARKFLQALYDAYDVYRQNPKQANDWFLQEAQLNGGDQQACEIAAGLEPNLKAKNRSEIRLSFTPEDIADLGRAAGFLKEKTGANVDVAKMIDNTYTTGLK